MTEFLTEEEIKHAALGFLKSHYKYRPRISDSQASLDNVAKNGLIADGLLSFHTDIDKKFKAAFEATSYGKAYEVKYKIHNTRLWWDSATFGIGLTSLLFILNYFSGWVSIGPERLAWTIMFLILLGFFLTSMFRLVFSRFSSYRWIYALEQFKLYDADEQWVSVGMDVFEHPDDKHLLELKRQCVLNGFGLIVVEDDLEIRQSITPARLPMEGKKRRKERFEALAQRQDLKPGLGSRFKNYTDSLTSSLGWENEKRFRYDFKLQLLFITGFLTAIGYILWKESLKTKETVLDNSKYREEMERRKAEKESGYYLVEDGEVVPFDENTKRYNTNIQRPEYIPEEYGYDKRIQDSLYHLFTDQGVRMDDIADSITAAKKKILADNSASPKNTNPATSSKTDNDSSTKGAGNGAPTKPKKKGVASICKEYANWWGKRYILQDGIYKSRKTAEYRVSQINKGSALGGILRGGCFSGSKAYYIVYVDVVYKDKGKAQKSLPYFNQLLKDKGYSSGELVLRDLSVRR